MIGGLFQRAFEGGTESRLLVDGADRVVAVSERYLQLTGRTRDSVIGRPLFELPPCAGNAITRDRTELTLETIRATGLSHPVHLADLASGIAEVSWTEAHLDPVRGVEGQTGFAVVTLQTTQRSMEEASQRERRLLKLIEHAYDVIALFGPGGDLQFVSPSITHLLGYSPSEFAALALAIIHPDDVLRFSEELKQLGGQPGSLLRTRIRVRHKDGSWRTQELASWNLNNDPDVAATVSNFHDVTGHIELQEELRRANEQLRSALSAASAVTWDIDLATRRGTFSCDYPAFFGVSEQAYLDQGPMAVVHPDDREELLLRKRRSVETGEEFDFEFRGLERPEGTRWYASHGRVLRTDEGHAERMVGVTWDITEQKRLLEERAAIDQRLRDGQKLESLGVMAGGIAHDFNNLLTAILGNANLARMRVQQGTALDDYLGQIEEASRRAADLCRQMLAYAGKGRFELAETNLNRLIEETTQLLQVSISKKAELRFRLAPELPSIVADQTQLRQVLMNLVINASEAIGDQDGQIGIRTAVVRGDRRTLDQIYLAPDLPEGPYVLLEVSDTGHGMSSETQGRIFEPFFSTKFTGRGLGLAAVLGIVRGHRGALKVSSEPGKGSCFKLLLPVEPRAKLASKPPPVPSLPPGVEGTVLVVDDEESVRTVTSMMLEAMGLRVLVAPDGREALRIYAAHAGEIAAVLMDLTMPHLDGEETFRELEGAHPGVSVLLMSGYSEQEASTRFAGTGLAGFLQKPFSIEELRDRVARLMRQR